MGRWFHEQKLSLSLFICISVKIFRKLYSKYFKILLRFFNAWDVINNTTFDVRYRSKKKKTSLTLNVNSCNMFSQNLFAILIFKVVVNCIRHIMSYKHTRHKYIYTLHTYTDTEIYICMYNVHLTMCRYVWSWHLEAVKMSSKNQLHEWHKAELTNGKH